jgi:hypothetical protein
MEYPCSVAPKPGKYAGNHPWSRHGNASSSGFSAVPHRFSEQRIGESTFFQFNK